MSPTRLWVGGYTADADGEALGISVAALDADGAVGEVLFAGEAASPSFVAQHPSLPVVYAVEEVRGTLRAFTIGAGGALAPLGDAVEAGLGPCHVALDPAGRCAVVACYGSGDVVAFALDARTGAIGQRAVGESARDPDAERTAERSSHAHYAHFLADGRVLTTDLGFDLVRVWRWSLTGEAVSLELDHEVRFPLGAEPRHVAVGAGGRVFVVGEASVAVYVLEADEAGRYAIAGSSPLRSPGSSGLAQHRAEYGAHVSLSADGTLLYAPVRGANVVAVLRVGAGGAVSPLGEVPCGGDWPRHHLVVGHRLYVANQRSNEVTVFALDADGLPGRVVQRVPTGSPAVLAPGTATRTS